MRWATVIVFCAGLVTGCAYSNPEENRPGYPGQTEGVRYVCATGGDLYVSYRRNRAIIQTQDGRIYRLREVPSASGASYSNGKHEWRTKGTEATWTTGRMVPIGCVAAPQPR